MWKQLMDGVGGISLKGLSLAFRNRSLAQSYMSECIRRHDELTGQGLPVGDPLELLETREWTRPEAAAWMRMPASLRDGGGMQLQELVYLAAVTQKLQPRKVFEIGTFNGRTTATFIQNSPPEAEVITMDLPVETSATGDASYIDTDVDLVARRRVGSFALENGLGDRFQQILCDSMQFDPTPHKGTVELAFIDGAHARPYVQNDTEKVALMMAKQGIVLWHDYGGKGRFRPLAEYLEELGQRAGIYRIERTTLAWSTAEALRKACGVAEP